MDPLCGPAVGFVNYGGRPWIMVMLVKWSYKMPTVPTQLGEKRFLVPSGVKTPHWVGLPCTRICEHFFLRKLSGWEMSVSAPPVAVVGDGVCGADGVFGSEFFNALCLHFSWMWVQQP